MCGIWQASVWIVWSEYIDFIAIRPRKLLVKVLVKLLVELLVKLLVELLVKLLVDEDIDWFLIKTMI